MAAHKKKAKKSKSFSTKFLIQNKKEIIIGVFAFVLLLSLLTNGFSGFFSTPQDMVVFLSADDCIDCADALMAVEIVAREQGINVKQVHYNIPELVPGFVIFYNGQILISPFRGQEVFNQQLQGFIQEHE